MIQHLPERLVALIDPDVLFLFIQAQILCQRPLVITVVPAADVPVDFFKLDFPCQITLLKILAFVPAGC